MDTAGAYRKSYNERIHAQAAANPNFLAEALDRTMQSLSELDLIRADAWKHLEDRTVRGEFQCPECEHEWTTKVKVPVPDQTRAQYHNVLLKAQDQRSKLFGVLGIKQEMLAGVMQIQYVQGRIIEWLAQNLEGDTKEALAQFLESELGDYMGTPGNGPLGVLDVESIEVVSQS
jgi:hypothetical protein